MSKNVKLQRYKTKAEFGADLDLIWENCLFFNTQEASSHFSMVSQQDGELTRLESPIACSSTNDETESRSSS